MRPTARSNRSPVHHPRSSPITIPSTTSSVYHQQQQQQQQILYAPVSNSMVTLQPCGTALHPPCVYPNVQPHTDSSNPIPLYLQGKNNRWHSKNKPSRGQQHYQQQQQQQQFSYNPKPVVLYEPPSSSIASIPPSTASFLVASSTFAHAGQLPGEHCNSNSGVTHLLQQPFSFKPPDVQTFCLIHDRQNAHQQQQRPMQASYYNISATNTCSLQTVNANSSFPLPNLTPYTSLATLGNNQFPSSVQSSQLFSNPPVSLVLAPPRADKPSLLSTLEFPPFKHNASKISNSCESQVVPIDRSENGWPSQIEISSKRSYEVQAAASNSKNLESVDCVSQKPISTKIEEEHYSDESSTSFDFTIEAEKMVSALCNTTSSNDLGKEESKPANKTDSALLFNGAGDNVSNKASWFTDFCSEYGNGTSIGVQTDNTSNSSCIDRSQYPELIRKTTYWGCTEAESVLASGASQLDSRQSWLTCLSVATRTAITKSTTCIPVFAGDRVFASDLINALLRISNGWLSLDNYLNKQHLSDLLDRLDPELITCFRTWEENTYELLKQIVQTFQKFGENNEATNKQIRSATCGSSSFPGDVSLYTSYDLFAQLPSSSPSQRNTIKKFSSQENSHNSTTSTPLSTNNLRNVSYASSQQEQQAASQKESKLRSRWTITENLSSTINATKSVPNVSVSHTDVGSKLRAKDALSFRKFDSTQKSLNAEFFQLRNKVMESNADAKDRRHDCLPEHKFPVSLDNTEFKLHNPTINTPISYSGLYAQNCLSFTFPFSGYSSSSYPASTPGILTYRSYPSSSSYPIADISMKSGRNSEQKIYGAKNANVNPIYVGRSQTDQIELPAVPRNKVTLLSQIEPRTFDKKSEEMATNLSVWFASMRNAQIPMTVQPFEGSRMNDNSGPQLFAQQEISKYSMPKQPQIDANRQFQALQNLPNIQSTPWAAGNFVNHRFQVQQAPEEYDSSEDVRVYMKPGSYNVPKKRHQRRPNRRSDGNATSRNAHAGNHHNKGKSISIPASSTPLSHTNASTLSTNINNATLIKTSFPPASQLPAPLFSLENSPRILKRKESLSQNALQEDVTWRAACASAEILLEALNVKDCSNTSEKIDSNDCIEKDNKSEEDAEALPTMSEQIDSKSMKCDEADRVSSYEVSEDDSASTCKLSPNASVISISQLHEDENALSIKTNVKTDSWLIRTLNNASIASKQKRRENDVDRRSSKSSNNSDIADIKPNHLASSIADPDTKALATTIDSEYPAIFSREHISSPFSKNDETSTKELESHVGRATYSETVRRSMKSNNADPEKRGPYKSGAMNSSMITVAIAGRKYQKKDSEQSYQLLHKSRRLAEKKAVKNADDLQLQEELCAKISDIKLNNVTPKLSTAAKTYGKKDLEHTKGKCAVKSADRGWSVWHSSRRKQILSPLAFSKLEIIHQTVCQMEEAKIFKYPSLDDNQFSSTGIVEDYCPMLLEIIENKLKNRIYHKVEHAVKDFRRVIHNARLHHQHNDERIKKIEVLSKKLEDLVEEHFGNWDLDNIIGSSREDSPVQRFKTLGQKSIAERCDNTKNASSLIIAENSLLH